MARQSRKGLADMRALEEEAERVNPVRGRGATPSMGLSQVRGGARRKMRSESPEEDLEGGGFLSDLGIPIISNLAGAIGLGHEHGEQMVGCGTGAGSTGAGLLGQDGHGQRQVGAGRRKKGMSEATQMGLHLGKHLHSLHGAGFFDDFKKGFMSVVGPVAGIAKSVLPLAGPEGMAAAGVMNAIGLGKHGGVRTGAYEGKGRGRKAKAQKIGEMELKQHELEHDALEGSGFLSDLGIPIISNLAGAIGLGTGAGSTGAGATGAGRRRRAPAGPGDGRRKRAEVVRRVMSEKGLSMIEESKYVKQHGLY